MSRYVIEGRWSGYTRSQEHVAHRSVHQGAFKRLRAWVETNPYIIFTDGTQLCLSVRDCLPRERVAQKHGYGGLIEDCAHYRVSSVAELRAIESLRKAPIQLATAQDRIAYRADPLED